jgi:hypothetical protein
MTPAIGKILALLNNRYFPVVAIVVLSFMLLRQCNVAQDAKREAERNMNNLLAEQDTVRKISSKLGNALAEKASFQLKYNELSKDQEELIKQLELARNRKPGVVIETRIVYRDTTILVPVQSEIGDSTNLLKFSYDPDLPGNNRLAVNGILPYTTKDTIFNGDERILIVPGYANLSIEQRIDLVTGLYRDPKTGRLFVRASTTFPGISFNDINALDMVDDPGTRKALRGARKPFGIGVNVGYGMVFTTNGYQAGPVIGIGLHYSPKFLQFGK